MQGRGLSAPAARETNYNPQHSARAQQRGARLISGRRRGRAGTARTASRRGRGPSLGAWPRAPGRRYLLNPCVCCLPTPCSYPEEGSRRPQAASEREVRGGGPGAAAATINIPSEGPTATFYLLSQVSLSMGAGTSI